ncbi:branched-chain amino acid permease [Renibacterium salmoninarum ATCC 33209]|uniref:Branched-chain amino acid permease n=1 Tax=Renibacterium salmoninarum (strain ATCC 33209 / DSM 20767 / JCM 11484 / NBRC 15589 / NCIMB 2235) TaxID=288705 RepID=A9WQ27_RENSM|nr:AzlC family ABC transporter permease [Renibacterium salmoninarum]ABY22454.1 branched-chain amino acid permease [Renibacterium salmoninarum ATCC 33209]
MTNTLAYFRVDHIRSIWRTLDRPTIRSILLICLSVGVVGISYGVTAKAAGFPLWQILALAILVLAASSEFLFVGIAAARGNLVAAVVAGLLVNIRNFAYGITAGEFLRPGWQKILGAHLVNDESVAVTKAHAGLQQKRAAFWLCGVGIMLCWPLGALTGALLGQVVQRPEVIGLDAIFPAALLALIAPSLRDGKTLLTAAAGTAVALAAIPFVPEGVAPLLALLAVVLVLPKRKKA